MLFGFDNTNNLFYSLKTISMKKMSWGLYGIGMALLLTSCVAKKKYVEAQNRISQLEQQNANCVSRTDSLSTSLSTLQQSNSALQSRYDSSLNAYSTQQTRWNDYTTYYTNQKSSADQMHQTLHQQLDDMIGASNIVLNNNKVYITLPESTLFTSGSTSLSTKGRNIVNTLATTIAQNPDVEVFVATTPVYGNDATAMNDANGMNSNMNSNSSMSNSNNGTYNSNNSSTVTNNSSTTNANVANNSGNYNNGSTTKTKSTYHKPSTSRSTSSYASNTRKTKSSYKSESSHKTMRSNYARSNKPSSSSSSMAVARASTIVSALRQQGVQKAGIQVTDPVNRTTTTARKYQVIVSPTNEGYYEMMGKGNIGTGMK